MAAASTILFPLQARDWETLIGIIANSGDTDIMELQFALTTFYRNATTKPQGTEVVSVATTEDLVVKIANYLYGNTVMNITKDSGTNAFSRIMTAVRAANNTADNYISTQLATNDAAYAATALAIRKNGRKIILMRQYDNA